MPTLTRLAISGLRNISEASLEPSPGFNLICGNNGSGKTSLLEAIYLLGMGRSFRSHLQKPLVSHEQSHATVFGQTAEGVAIGIQKPVRGPQTIKIGGKPAEGLAHLTRNLPIQLINTDTFQLLEGSPRERRQFLDWGVFHVEHLFLEYWRRARQALEHRNTLIRNEAATKEIEPWSYELAQSAEFMDQYRRIYLVKLQTLLETRLETIGTPGGHKLLVEYSCGWDKEGDLYTQLQESLPKDRRYGHTTVGPHKADLKFKANNQDISEIWSRGQLKLLISTLKIVQAELLHQATQQHCLMLLDDLPAELDSENRTKVCALLGNLKAQTFITSIEPEMVANIVEQQAKQSGLPHAMFHVKHGSIGAA